MRFACTFVFVGLPFFALFFDMTANAAKPSLPTDSMLSKSAPTIWYGFIFYNIRCEQSIEIPFAFERGEGRKALVAFARSDGSVSQSTRQLGELSAEQQRRNAACTRRDPDGVWIRLMGCEDEEPPPITLKLTVERLE